MLTAPTAAWPSSDGKTYHTDYMKYLKHELELMLAKVTENTVAAKKIVDSITKENIGDYATLFNLIGAEFEMPSSFEVKRTDSVPIQALRLTSKS